jgi:hypothetical protein
LPPGATNYTTARGAKRLRDELQKVRAANPGSERVAELEQILASIHVVDPTDAPANSVTFGATVTVQDKKGATETFIIVGVDELDFRTRRGELDFFTWQSAAERGNGRLDYTLRRRTARIVKIEAQLIGDA